MTPRIKLLAMLAVVVAIAALGTACSDSGGELTRGSSTGNVRVVMSAEGATAPTSTDATGLDSTVTQTEGGTLTPSHDRDDDHDRPDQPMIESVEIVLSDILARSVTQKQLVSLNIDLPVNVDLRNLRENGGQVDLGVGDLPPDTYDQMVVVISSLRLTATNGTVVEITPPGGGWTMTVAVVPFEVVEGEITTVQLRLRDRSIKFKLDFDIHDIDHHDFEPEFEVEIRD